jgi:signal transduction histidine kinase/CheY-like chemotaxis protein
VSERNPIEELLHCVAEMPAAERRAAAGRAVAQQAGAVDLIVFVRDGAAAPSLPALGFPQTLRDGRTWRALLERAIAAGQAEREVPFRDGALSLAHAYGLADGTVLVLLDGTPHEPQLAVLRSLLPMFGALFRMELAAQRARAESTLARQSAAQSAELTGKLDVTLADLQRALLVAETATRARDEFLATVSHELRTPLTSMIGWVQLLRDERDPEVLAEGLETIDRNARAQGRLIEDILDFSRINAGKLRLDVRPVELIDVINEAVDVVRPAADAKGLRLNCVLDPNVGLVSGDPDRLQQVVWNLLSNAVKFTPRGGRVQVRLQRANSHAELTVSDTGEGIAPSFLPFVFDRFSQADSSSSRSHGGLGLGLGIVRHLVELHGGAVQAFSAGPGEGAMFTVRLPLIAAHQHQEDRPAAADRTLVRGLSREPLADLTGVSVLVVEDHVDARALLKMILQKCGAAVQTAANVPEALALLRESRPDLIISDIEMPGEDGYSFIRKVRAEETTPGRIPAIALTAYTRGVDRVRALAAGFQTHMSKPVEPAELAAAVKSLLSTVGTRTPSS